MLDDPLLRRLFDLAAPSEGCVAVGQLDAAGIGHDMVMSLVERGALTRVVNGVYLVGARTLTDRQAIWSGLLAAGADAVASHFTAAQLHGILEHPADDVWITAPNRRHSRVVRTLLPVASTGNPATIRIIATASTTTPALRDLLPVRTSAGALVDLAGQVHPRAAGRRRRRRPSTLAAGIAPSAHSACAPRRIGPRDVVRAWKEADYRNQLRKEAVEQELGRGIAGSGLIRQLLATYPIASDDDTDVATRPEYALLAAVLRLGLPRPLTNQPLQLPGATYFPDQFYPGAGLVVEADGGVHRRKARRAADRARDAHMRANGLEVLRFANEAIDADADACALDVAEALERRTGR